MRSSEQEHGLSFLPRVHACGISGQVMAKAWPFPVLRRVPGPQKSKGWGWRKEKERASGWDLDRPLHQVRASRCQGLRLPR